MKHGVTWREAGEAFRWVYRKYKGRTYRRKQKMTKKGWIFVGIVFVALAAGMYAPAGGFSWLFKMTYL